MLGPLLSPGHPDALDSPGLPPGWPEGVAPGKGTLGDRLGPCSSSGNRGQNAGGFNLTSRSGMAPKEPDSPAPCVQLLPAALLPALPTCKREGRRNSFSRPGEIHRFVQEDPERPDRPLEGISVAQNFSRAQTENSFSHHLLSIHTPPHRIPMLGVECGASHKPGSHPEQVGDGGGSSQKTSTKEALPQQQGSWASASTLHLDAKTFLSQIRTACSPPLCAV